MSLKVVDLKASGAQWKAMSRWMIERDVRIVEEKLGKNDPTMWDGVELRRVLSYLEDETRYVFSFSLLAPAEVLVEFKLKFL